MADLTPRQSEALAVIRRWIHDNGYPPTYREVADAMGMSSTNAASEMLLRLHEIGVIQLVPGKSRGIRLTDDTQDTHAAALRNAELEQGITHLQAMVEYAECNDPLNPHLAPAQRYLKSVTEAEGARHG